MLKFFTIPVYFVIVYMSTYTSFFSAVFLVNITFTGHPSATTSGTVTFLPLQGLCFRIVIFPLSLATSHHITDSLFSIISLVQTMSSLNHFQHARHGTCVCFGWCALPLLCGKARDSIFFSSLVGLVAVPGMFLV